MFTGVSLLQVGQIIAWPACSTSNSSSSPHCSQAHLEIMIAKLDNPSRMASSQSMNGEIAYWPFVGQTVHSR
jgi:hypothetical protein